MPDPIPDAVEPVLGWRLWRATSAGLVSLNHGGRWPRGEPEVAYCDRGDETWGMGFRWMLSTASATTGVLGRLPSEDHEPPGDECGCGIYGLPNFESIPEDFRMELLRRSTWVVGQIHGWGRVAVHERGWRASQAKPAAIMVWPSMPEARKQLSGEMAEMYDVPLAEFESKWIETKIRELAEAELASQRSMEMLRGGLVQAMGSFTISFEQVSDAFAKLTEGMETAKANVTSWGCMNCGRDTPKSQGRYCRKCWRRQHRRG